MSVFFLFVSTLRFILFSPSRQIAENGDAFVVMVVVVVVVVVTIVVLVIVVLLVPFFLPYFFFSR